MKTRTIVALSTLSIGLFISQLEAHNQRPQAESSLEKSAARTEQSPTQTPVALQGPLGDHRVEGDPTAEFQAYLANRYPQGALKAVVTSSQGHLFDCVDKARQPALKRADGTFAKVATPPKAVEGGAQNALSAGEAVAQVESITCPAGSVPMMHVDMAMLSRFNSLAEFFSKHPSYLAEGDATARTGSTATHQYAKVDQYVDNWGGDGVFNLWNPYVETSSEFSLSQMWVVRGSGSLKETLETGWQDYDGLYGDNTSHLFIYSTQDGYGATGCYNGTCGDFVQYSATITPAIAFSNYSSYGGTQYIIQLRWQRDDTNDNWWLMYGTQWVGYYKGSLFDSNGVKDKAARVSYGGEIIDDNGTRHTYTDMGSGGYPSSGWTHTAYTRTLRTISTSNVWQAASSASEFRTDDYCYDVDLSYSAGTWANYFYFGGEGYGTDCQ